MLRVALMFACLFWLFLSWLLVVNSRFLFGFWVFVFWVGFLVLGSV